MNSRTLPNRQNGAALVVGLIMLVLITLMVTSSFSLSNSNLKAVGNMQFRSESLAAANKAIEQIVSSPFTTTPSAEDINIDINNDGITDYVVQFSQPVCISARQLPVAPTEPSSLTLSGQFQSSASILYETVWDLDAHVIDQSNSGATIEVHEGVRVPPLTKDQYDAVCS